MNIPSNHPLTRRGVLTASLGLGAAATLTACGGGKSAGGSAATGAATAAATAYDGPEVSLQSGTASPAATAPS